MSVIMWLEWCLPIKAIYSCNTQTKQEPFIFHRHFKIYNCWKVHASVLSVIISERKVYQLQSISEQEMRKLVPLFTFARVTHHSDIIQYTANYILRYYKWRNWRLMQVISKVIRSNTRQVLIYKARRFNETLCIVSPVKEAIGIILTGAILSSYTWLESLEQTQNMLVRLYVLLGLGKFWNLPEGIKPSTW